MQQIVDPCLSHTSLFLFLFLIDELQRLLVLCQVAFLNWAVLIPPIPKSTSSCMGCNVELWAINALSQQNTQMHQRQTQRDSSASL